MQHTGGRGIGREAFWWHAPAEKVARLIERPDRSPARGRHGRAQSLHFIASGQSALPIDSMGNPWNGTYVFSSGNLRLDLLHNFFLECRARANKIRVYEMVDDPVAREMVGYLLVRDGTHIVAYASFGSSTVLPRVAPYRFIRPSHSWRRRLVRRGWTPGC